MKAKTISRLALICAVLALIVSLLTLLRPQTDTSGDQLAQLEQLRQQNSELQSRVDDLQDRLDSLVPTLTLQDWSFRIAPRADASGAEITLVAVPGVYEDDMVASLMVHLEGREVASQDCIWDGKAFVGSVDLDAADGYSYYCVLVSPSGSRQQFPLTTVENPVDTVPIQLASSLGSHIRLTVETFEAGDDSLILTGGTLALQLPQLSADDVSLQDTCLVLSVSGEEASRTPVTLESGDRYGSYSLALMDLALELPKLGKKDRLELTLEATLSNGQTLRSTAAAWQLTNGQLQFAE